MESEGFRPGLRELVKRGLPLDAVVFQPQLPKLTALVDAFPDLTFVLNHMGLAVDMDMNAADTYSSYGQSGRSSVSTSQSVRWYHRHFPDS